MILLSKEDIMGLEPLCEKNRGSGGKCYRYGDVAIKLLHNKTPFYTNNIKSLMGLKDEGISFPIDKTDFRKSYIAYSMPILEGESLYNIKRKIIQRKMDISLNELSIIGKNTTNRILKASELGIQVADVNLSNILVQPNLFVSIIDVDRWNRNYNIDKNITHINTYLYSFLNSFYLGSLENLRIINAIKTEGNKNYVDELIEYTKMKKPYINSLGDLRR